MRIFCAFFLLLIFFLRHFQRWLPRFFQAREPLFMMVPSLNALASVAGRSGFEPEASGLEGQRYILAKPPARTLPPIASYDLKVLPMGPSDVWILTVLW